jgi:predicted ATP-dependent Lon-type protease
MKTEDSSVHLGSSAESMRGDGALALTRADEYPDPTPEMLNDDALFDAIWDAIKGWDISRHNDGLYSGPTGNDARHIYDAIKRRGALKELAALQTIVRDDPNGYYAAIARAALAQAGEAA